jgi:hypothetical protein
MRRKFTAPPPTLGKKSEVKYRRWTYAMRMRHMQWGSDHIEHVLVENIRSYRSK